MIGHFCNAGRWAWVLAALALTPMAVHAQQADSAPPPPKPKPWHERYSLRGYTHIRYNDLFLDNPDYQCQACDRAIGGVKDFSVRRARIVVAATPIEQAAIKLEIDLANTLNGTQQFFLQMREAYGDYFLDKHHNAWVRFGLAKVPFGFENLQSSSVRLPLDRADAINSGVPGERDLGAIFFWGTAESHRILKAMADSGYKGQGDNGIFSVAVYNGQSANRAEANDEKHVAVRLAYPFRVGSQVVELAAQGYTGVYTLTPDLRSDGVAAPEGYDFDDRRVALSAALYPRPIGLLAEWNWGDGPRYDAARNATVNGTVNGGYVQAMYRVPLPGGRVLFPFARWQHYEGGKKNELDARFYDVDEVEAGVEVLLVRALEVTASYVHGDRTFLDGDRPENRQEADFVRLQLQLNY